MLATRDQPSAITHSKRHRLVVAFLIVPWFTPAAPAFAVNPLFMPGDAFFHSRLTEATLKKTSPNGIELSYDIPAETLAFCGYCGFSTIVIRGDTESLSRQLKELHASLRKEFPLDERVYSDGRRAELNPFHLFIYNRNVDWESRTFRLAIKYNEGWREPPVKALEGVKDRIAKLSRDRVRYTTFVNSTGAVINDWQHGIRFDPLRAEVPEGVPWAVHGKPIQKPVVIDATEVQLVVTDSNELAPYFERKEGYGFYVITDTATTGYQFDEDGKLKAISTSGTYN